MFSAPTFLFASCQDRRTVRSIRQLILGRVRWYRSCIYVLQNGQLLVNVCARRSVHEGISTSGSSAPVRFLVTDRQGATIVVFQLVVPINARIPRDNALAMQPPLARMDSPAAMKQLAVPCHARDDIQVSDHISFLLSGLNPSDCLGRRLPPVSFVLSFLFQHSFGKT